jgi:RND family efflux transporter MFP subunit
VARKEWERLNREGGGEPNPLVLYVPQLKQARAVVASASAALRQAELNLARTRVTAPFNCLVRSEQIDIGQYVKSGTAVADLAGTDTAEIVVPLSLEDLRWLDVPGDVNGTGSPADVRLVVGERNHSWQGRIVRSLGEVDPRGRMARVVVAVDDPYGTRGGKSGERPALPLGAFVQVVFRGAILPAVAAVPRGALRENSTVWIMDEDRRLRIRPVRVARMEREEVLVAGGVEDGEFLVLTALSGAADGMKLRPAGRGEELR